jgi:hypothetical protein
MDFERMKYGCPWMIEGGHHDDPDLIMPDECRATKMTCIEEHCGPFHWVYELSSNLYVSVDAELRTD